MVETGDEADTSRSPSLKSAGFHAAEAGDGLKVALDSGEQRDSSKDKRVWF